MKICFSIGLKINAGSTLEYLEFLFRNFTVRNSFLGFSLGGIFDGGH
jgi:hypothetical protein